MQAYAADPAVNVRFSMLVNTTRSTVQYIEPNVRWGGEAAHMWHGHVGVARRVATRRVAN